MPGVNAQITIQPGLAPESAEFKAYAERIRAGANIAQLQGVGFGLIPEPTDWTHNTSTQIVLQAETGATLPSSYDLRTQNKLTAVRNQSSCGCCWAFAAAGSLESTLKPAETWDFSENSIKDKHGFDLTCCDGGNRGMATAYMVRWDGPVAESDDPYNAGSCTSPSGLSTRKHVQEVLFLPNRSGPLDNDIIKQAVMDYGAVYSTYYHSDSYYNSSTRAYYYPSGSTSNHAICIVGWDDNFDRSKFISPPPGNGAFLIRNSWGTWWGDSGYFWISYYDAIIGYKENGVFFAEPANNYSAIYQYDPLGQTASVSYSWSGNVFTSAASETLAAAAFYTLGPNTTYTLYIYLNPTNGPKGSVAAYTKSGTLDFAGYHTITIDTPVALSAGQRFSVVVRLSGSYSYPTALERPISGYSMGATASAGQSYASNNGNSWIDVAASYGNTNVCIKAFTVRATPVSIAAAKALADGSQVSVTGLVSGLYNGFIYVQEPSRTGGIRVVTNATGLRIGDNVTATGKMSSHKPDGSIPSERQIEAQSVVKW